MCRVGQNHIYTVYIRYFWQGNHQIYGHIRCIYTGLANPIYVESRTFVSMHAVEEPRPMFGKALEMKLMSSV